MCDGASSCWEGMPRVPWEIASAGIRFDFRLYVRCWRGTRCCSGRAVGVVGSKLQADRGLSWLGRGIFRRGNVGVIGCQRGVGFWVSRACIFSCSFHFRLLLPRRSRLNGTFDILRRIELARIMLCLICCVPHQLFLLLRYRKGYLHLMLLLLLLLLFL